MTIADRMAVLDGGVLQQVGTPRELYDAPANRFVAEFVGSTNVLSGRGDPDRNIFVADGLGRPAAAVARERSGHFGAAPRTDRRRRPRRPRACGSTARSERASSSASSRATQCRSDKAC